MSIILVGGHDRMHSVYKDTFSKMGHKVKIFTQMPAHFNKKIGKPDVILLFTKTVSHKMVITAMKEAKRKNIPVLRCHNSSTHSLWQSIKKLESNL